MPIHCPKCGKEHDVITFQGGKKVKCRCGLKLDLSLMNSVDDFLRYCENEEERAKANIIQQEAQMICLMILDEECAKVDIELAKEVLREKVKGLFPDKLATYEMIYEARFKRLWEQFRQDS